MQDAGCGPAGIFAILSEHQVDALNHVSNLSQCLKDLAALTLPGGTLVLSIDAHHYPILKQLFQWIPGDILHPHQYSLKEYEDMLNQNGFVIQKRRALKLDWIFTYWQLTAQRI